MKNFIKFLVIGACLVFLLTLLFPLEEKKFDLEITSTKTNVIVMQGEKEVEQGKNVLTKGETYTIIATAFDGSELFKLTVNGEVVESGSTVKATQNIVIVAISAVITSPPNNDIVVEPEEPVATPANYFTFNDGTLTGFSAEGQAAYDAGELTELILPSSYSLGELATEEVTYTDFFELDMYCRENGYNFTFVNGEGETVAITSEEEFMNNYETLMTLWVENQSITVTMQNQKFVDGTDVDVTSLGEECFRGCTALTSVTISNSVTSLGDYCFQNCTSLNAINVSSDNTTYKSIDGIVYSKDGTTLIMAPGGIVNVTIPEGVTSLGANCFISCRALTSITLPNSVTSLGNSCFDGCTSLTSITLPNSITSLGANCFYSCTSLTSITISNSVTSLGTSCFRECTALTSITLPEGVTSLPNHCFYNCSALTSITLPNSITSLGTHCFYGCSVLTSITLPEGVTSLGGQCFSGCTALTSITLPNSITSLGEECFRGCTALTSVTISNSVTSIGDRCFQRCSALTSITIPDNVTSLGGGCFSHCTSLTSINIPNSVTSIGDACFYNCIALTSITVQSSNCTLGSANVFDNTNNCPIYVPAEALEAYKVATNWSTYADRLQAIVA